MAAATAAAEGVCLNHIALETSNIPRLSAFYQEVFGLEPINTIKMDEIRAVWLRVPASSFAMHIIERGPPAGLDEGPTVAADNRKALLHGHLCFSISNYGSFVQVLKERGLEADERTRRDGRKVALFSDPDGNDLEIVSSEAV